MDKTKEISESSRIKEVLTVLSKYGLTDWMRSIDTDWIQDHFKGLRKQNLTQHSQHELIRLAITDLGTTFIKLGQLLSTRQDIVGKDLAEELSKLQSSTPSDSFEDVSATILNEFGITDILEKFETFNESPIASASVGQVHEATIEGGKRVAVKVMHKGVEAKVMSDLKVIEQLADLAERYLPSIRVYRPSANFRQFKRTLIDELDLRKELKNTEKIAGSLNGISGIHVPITYPEYSGKTVLTLEFITGVSVQKISSLGLSKDHRAHLADVGVNAYMKMIFHDNFYHADPHPGNILIRPDGSLCVLDCGMVGRIDSKTNEWLEDLMVAVAQKDSDQIKDVILSVSGQGGSMDKEVFRNQIDDFIETYLQLTLGELDMGEAMRDMMLIINQHHIELPANISSLIRVIVILEGTGKKIDPDLNIAATLESYQYEIIRSRFKPIKLFKRLIKNVKNWDQIITETPISLLGFLRKAQSENFKIHLEHKNLEKSVNRLVLGILTASLYLGSSLLWSSNVPPRIGDISVVGVSGTILALAIALILVREIFKSK